MAEGVLYKSNKKTNKNGGTAAAAIIADSKKRPQPFYRKAVPIEIYPAHKVKPEKAGLMLDPSGDPFDCMGRYTSYEIEQKFGGKRAV